MNGYAPHFFRRTSLGDELTLTIADEQLQNKAGLCTKVLMDMQRLLACLLMVDDLAAGSHALSQQMIHGIKTIVSNGLSCSPRCSLLIRTSTRLKTGV